MPNLSFSHAGVEFEAAMLKVDRTKLYGRVRDEILDENGEPCEMMTLSSDGRTLIPSGGIAFGYLSPDGQWRTKSDLLPFNLEGEQIEPVSSTLKQTTVLDTPASLDDFLGTRFRLAYQLEAGEGGLPEALLEELRAGTIYSFPFSYRGGLQADAAFLLASADGAPWLLVGTPARIEFIGFEAASCPGVEEATEDGGLDDLLDFGVM